MESKQKQKRLERIQPFKHNDTDNFLNREAKNPMHERKEDN